MMNKGTCIKWRNYLPAHQKAVEYTQEKCSLYLQFHLLVVHEATYKNQMQFARPLGPILLDAVDQIFPSFQLLLLYISTNSHMGSKIYMLNIRGI